jgi:hypothetical protein
MAAIVDAIAHHQSCFCQTSEIYNLLDFIEAITPHVLKQNQAIAQSTHCDRSILSRLGQGCGLLVRSYRPSCSEVKPGDRPIEALRSPVIHCVYARIEKPITDWIVYRGDRPSHEHRNSP